MTACLINATLGGWIGSQKPEDFEQIVGTALGSPQQTCRLQALAPLSRSGSLMPSNLLVLPNTIARRDGMVEI